MTCSRSKPIAIISLTALCKADPVTKAGSLETVPAGAVDASPAAGASVVAGSVVEAGAASEAGTAAGVEGAAEVSEAAAA